jgi:Flp pilus assembly pilin Flp
MRAGPAIFCKDDRGATAVEFAIAGPIFILLLMGLFYLCMCLAVAGSVHYAVQESARCASVRTTVCRDDSSTITYAQNHYFGPGSLPAFTYDAAAPWGHSVRACIDYIVDLASDKLRFPSGRKPVFRDRRAAALSTIRRLNRA